MKLQIGLTIACLLGITPAAGLAQQTSTSVYTNQQADLGADVFAGMCQSCHVPGTFTAPSFQDTWRGKSLWQLFAYISEKMPKNDPGSLETADYLHVLAYLLKVNGMPAGTAELSTDSVALKTIRFEPAEKVRKEH